MSLHSPRLLCAAGPQCTLADGRLVRPPDMQTYGTAPKAPGGQPPLPDRVIFKSLGRAAFVEFVGARPGDGAPVIWFGRTRGVTRRDGRTGLPVTLILREHESAPAISGPHRRSRPKHPALAIHADLCRPLIVLMAAQIFLDAIGGMSGGSAVRHERAV